MVPSGTTKRDAPELSAWVRVTRSRRARGEKLLSLMREEGARLANDLASGRTHVDEDRKVIASLGGPYTQKGDEYVEMPEYGVGTILDALKGNPQVFKWKVDGNKWYHNGQLSGGTTIEEVWERVEKSK